ncbi:penicillin acylase family protein [Algoriphagus sediminis]|uniref:Penicillin acylase family protein n=1 Tax=Algoriphagus sediminis TaxID=3057113 RepID=A0ABT7Y9R1_9BACT|nr:penicillin acylase family protein [Algoriphagus sediminis]MDN3203255.1 penicillin acylase family protein [Algoriphagus sediminis]
MNSRKSPTLLILFIAILFSCNPGADKSLDQLREDVEVIRDENGINHIFAQNEEDLFFMQGYLAARDRLFQFEIWRRQATGTLAEILGEREFERDRGVRLFKFRGDKETELRHYHPRGVKIVDSFVSGINAYITEANANPESLPIEFQMLGIKPEPWTWEVVISRHQGLLENVKDELEISRVVSLIGKEEAKKLYYFHPNEPILEIDSRISKDLLFRDILAPYEAFRTSVKFQPEDLKPEFQAKTEDAEIALAEWENELKTTLEADAFAQGSNNWVLSGKKTESGFPFMANDPHRLQAAPSLRYWVHLNAPGWNVVGGGEPVIPGVSIGHNDFGAWGLTIFSTDNEDMRVYDLHPDDPNRYWFNDEWKTMESIQDTIQIKNQEPRIVTHFFTVHGPVTFIDEELDKAVAVQCAWLEPGSAPYLASLKMDQSQSWEEFREACANNYIPAENMVWADRDGNIGWQATGIAPIRKGFSGLVPTMGDGSLEWEGYLPIEDRPHNYNPESGFIATANENLAKEDYPFPEALGFEWSDNYRGERIREVLSQDKKFTIAEMGALQNDYLSLPARELIPFLQDLSFENSRVDSLKETLSTWDFTLNPESVQAGVYVMWERELRKLALELAAPEEVREFMGAIQLTRVIDWVKDPVLIFDSEAEKQRNSWLSQSFEKAISALEQKLGPNPKNWQYGQEDYKHALIYHPLGRVVSEEWKSKLNAGPLPRGGYSFTPSANAYGDNNTSGASFRILVDTEDWEGTQGINNPGQSGDVASPFYKNLFPIWANDEYVGIPFEIESVRNMAHEIQVFRAGN